MNNPDAYTQGFDDKLASVGQHIRNVYEGMKDKLPDFHPDEHLLGQTAIGGATGAGIGGLSALVGQSIPRVLAQQLSKAQGVPIRPDQVHLALQMASATGQGFKGNTPGLTRAFALASRLGKAPLLATAIPAGILALIANIRARKR